MHFEDEEIAKKYDLRSIKDAYLLILCLGNYILKLNYYLISSLIGNSNSINMRVKIAPETSGLILWTGGDNMSPASDYLMLGVSNHGKLHFRFNLGNGEAVLVYNATSIDDGRWHRIKATR